ncbi:MAG TPA: DUF1559 domain-containing protein, partial [Pirellulales bacterium]|nr:DUF1559 domain-containing protein [Pirellulales bacterium]
MHRDRLPRYAPTPPFQFSLGTLLGVVTGFAVFLAVAVQLGFGAFLLFIWITSLFVMWVSERFARPAGYLFWGGALVMLLFYLVPAVQPARTGGRRPQCVNNLKQLALGLQEYADACKCFPPAYIADEQGRPMHSWRVLVLPYIEGKALYDRYDFSEPWDGPHNRQLAKEMPAVFHCPQDGPAGGTTTSYMAVVGPETIWPGSKPMPLGKIRDGLSNTIILVEVADSGVNWMEPRDVPFSAIQAGINPPQ